MNYNRINNLTGWGVFLFALWVFVSTMEPTASFWDCGEFISCSYKLMAPHPPGAPLFLLIGRLFSLFASDVTKVAYMVNLVSAVSSAMTVLFLFWSITLLAKKIFTPSADGTYTRHQTLSIMASGIIGATAYTFTDSFWFSAVEAEVYAMSSFFTAVVFWAILKWESHADESGSDRWLVLIAYLVGLSIGVHLLNLTAIPALALVFYFKRYKNPNIKGSLIALTISMVALGFVMVGVIPGLPSIAASMDVFFVNSLGMSFGSGIIFFALLVVGGVAYGIYQSHKKGNRVVNTSFISFAFILVGYFSYGVIVIRSHYNTPIDMNDPENIMTFVSYLKREQYGDRPLLKGPHFMARPIRYDRVADVYAPSKDAKGNDRYVVIDKKVEPVYKSSDMQLFPRMYSSQPGHAQQYREWMKMSPTKVPGFFDNIKFMITYQMGHMYWRYFMWNFAGRSSDEQDAASISIFTQLSSQHDDYVSKARNNFYLLPLILGIVGLAYHYSKNQLDAIVVLALFFFTGLAIIIYLNQPPVEPRERDYTFAASFYAFAIWIGLGVVALQQLLEKHIFKKETLAALAITVTLTSSVPAILGQQGWDDHDRSQRYFQVESAKNLLSSCAPNAILFTGGDNDTYPLWYVQEVEGFRTDVRVCNLSLMNTDWYIDQMKRKAYLSEPLPISLDRSLYQQGTNDYLYLDEEALQANPNTRINLPVFLELIAKKDPRLYRISGGSAYVLYPSQNFVLPVDSAAVSTADYIDSTFRKFITSSINFTVNGGGMDKRTYAILDMIVTNNWKRPIYFSTTLSPSDYIGLKSYMQLEGLAYRLVPATIPGVDDGWVNTKVMKENLMKFQFTNLAGNKIFYDENYQRFTINAKSQYVTLANQLLREGDSTGAKQVVYYCMSKVQAPSIPYDYFDAYMVGILFQAGDKQKAYDHAKGIITYCKGVLAYLKADGIRKSSRKQTVGYTLNIIKDALRDNGYTQDATDLETYMSKNIRLN
ncbi:MAG: DUF2723 domain-containing protein [Cytophagaceae bacterium]|jgi:hypothetical protein|nr:DUF2723 domain-containing protein [Cytophagaceae bacterium]